MKINIMKFTLELGPEIKAAKIIECFYFQMPKLNVGHAFIFKCQSFNLIEFQLNAIAWSCGLFITIAKIKFYLNFS